MFQNPEIALEDLPRVDGVDWQRLHERYVRQLQVARLGFLLFVVAAIVAFQLIPKVDLPAPLAPYAIVVVLGLPYLLWPLVAVPRRGYVVRERDLVYRTGVLWRSVTAIPFNRIQHVETSSTPLDRRFGAATLKIFTAGGSGGDLNIDGLPAETAEQLRTLILEKVGASIERHE